MALPVEADVHGRLGGQPEIFPVNFATQRPTVLFRTAEGTKLFSAVVNDQVTGAMTLPAAFTIPAMALALPGWLNQ